MICLIPYKKQSNGIELRYSIRSIIKHFEGIDDIIIIGDKPEWFNGTVIPHASAALPARKENNLVNKINKHAPAGDFLYSNDDFFLNKSFNVETFPAFYSYTCRHMAMQSRDMVYRRLYSNCPGDWLNYDTHAPSVMHGTKFRSFNLDGTYPVRTGYFNRLKHGSFLSQEYPDNKIRHHHTRHELIDIIGERPFFSTHESAINGDLVSLLDELFPDATRFES